MVAMAGADPAPEEKLRVLVVDDEKNIRQTLGMFLEKLGCDVHLASTGEAAVSALAHQSMELAFLDLRLGSERGEDLIPKLLALGPSLPIVVFTAYATIETAVDTLRRGAWDYLPKPYTPEQIRQLVTRARERRGLTQQVADLESRLARAQPALDTSSESPPMRQVYDLIARAAKTDAQVLFRGETGTGKTALARLLHDESARRDRPFAVVNCPTLSADLLASELFGHARGAFTGAVKDQPGRVDAADGGTLFLDEIGELPVALQAKLLRFLQDKQYERVGENETRTADVRIIAATNRDIEADIQAGHFREDLFYRLNVIEIRVPALRERPEDILRLARRFLAFFAAHLRAAGARAVEGSRRRSCSPTAGPATCASCATPSSARRSSGRPTCSRARRFPIASPACSRCGRSWAETSRSTTSSASTSCA